MRKISVVTTFHKPGLEKYGQRMIDSFVKNWPKEISLYVYAEDCNPNIPADNIILRDLHKCSPELVQFKNKWKNVPKANGDVSKDPIRSRRKDAGKGFKWDAIRFSHKVYSIFHCAKNCDADILMWMDADTVCHSPISLEKIQSLIPDNFDLCYLGREPKWPECGLYAINLKSNLGQTFLTEFQRVYDDAEQGIFTMEEWHDSFVFEEVRKSIKPVTHNWSAGLVRGEGHPLINSEWGAYLDHLKGDRKDLGRSKSKDLIKPRKESYWK
jgi:hypothetical protein